MFSSRPFIPLPLPLCFLFPFLLHSPIHPPPPTASLPVSSSFTSASRSFSLSSFYPCASAMAAGKSLRGSPIIATALARERETIITDIINSLAEAGAPLTRNSSVLLAANSALRPKCKVCLGSSFPSGSLNCDISPSCWPASANITLKTLLTTKTEYQVSVFPLSKQEA